jgi:hypothetical protein
MARRPAIIKAKSSKKGTRSPRRGLNRFSLMPTDNWENAKFFAHYEIERKDCGNKVKDYIKKNFDKKVLVNVNRLPDWKVDNLSHWAATAHLVEVNPGIVPEIYKIGIVKWVNELSAEGSTLSTKTVEDEVKPVRKVNIQEVMREKADEALSEIEAIFDEFINSGYAKNFNVNKRVVGALSSHNVLPQHLTSAIKRYNQLLSEYLEVQSGKCDQLNEGYSRYSKMQIRYMIKFIEDVIAEMNGYISLKQVTKKPRAKKAVPVEKVVSRLKYCKTFKDESLNLELTGLSPTKLHQCSEAFVYDTAKRKIIWLVADDYSKSLSVKGNTVLGFDKKKSMSKTVRKPGEFLKAMMSASRPATRKMIDEIKAVSAIPNGRFNENIVILKVW